MEDASFVLISHYNSSPSDLNRIQNFLNKYSSAISNEASAIIEMNHQTFGYVNVANILGSSEGLLFDLMKCQEISSPLRIMTPITEKDIEKLKQMKSPFYAEYITACNEKLIAQIEQNKSRRDTDNGVHKESDKIF